MATNFPTSIDSYSTKVDGADYPQASHINNPQDAIVALQSKVGINSSIVSTSHDYKLSEVTDKAVGKTATQTLTNKTLTSPVINTPTGDVVTLTGSQVLTNKTLTTPTLTSPVLNTGVSGTAVLDEDSMVSDSATKLATQQSIKAYVDAKFAAGTNLSSVYPVGCIYTSTVSTNPATVFGMGTWTAFGAGKVLIGIDSGDTDFDTVEETGGAKTVSVAHTHTGASHTHSYSGTTSGRTLIGDVSPMYDVISSAQNDHTHTFSGTTGAEGTGNTGAMSANATPSIVQPYVVVYFFKRTA